LNRSALLVTLAPLEGNEDFDALSSATNILYVAAVAGLSASKRRNLPPRTGKGGRLQPVPGGEPAPGGRPGAGSETRRREKENPPNPAPGRRILSPGEEESFKRRNRHMLMARNKAFLPAPRKIKLKNLFRASHTDNHMINEHSIHYTAELAALSSVSTSVGNNAKN
jgi:hypothetical protein